MPKLDVSRGLDVWNRIIALRIAFIAALPFALVSCALTQRSLMAVRKPMQRRPPW